MYSHRIFTYSALVLVTQAALVVVPPTSTCTDEHADGNMWSCAAGSVGCQYNGTKTSNCFVKNDYDIGHSFCFPDQAIMLKQGWISTAGGPKCSDLTNPYTGGPYEWVFSRYVWQCCDCPAGYRPAGEYSYSVDGFGPPTYDTKNGVVEKTCAKCSDPGETLTYDPARYQWYCAGGDTNTHTQTPTHTHKPTKTTKPPTKTPNPPGKPCVVDSKGLDFLKDVESYHSRWYKDGDSRKIGYGHNCDTFGDCGKKVKSPISKDDATTLLKQDLRKFQECVGKLPNARSLNISQFNALVSFAYNQGCVALSEAFDKLMTHKDFDGVCKALPTTNTNQGALSKRRKQEAQLCSSPSQVQSGC